MVLCVGHRVGTLFVRYAVTVSFHSLSWPPPPLATALVTLIFSLSLSSHPPHPLGSAAKQDEDENIEEITCALCRRLFLSFSVCYYYYYYYYFECDRFFTTLKSISKSLLTHGQNREAEIMISVFRILLKYYFRVFILVLKNILGEILFILIYTNLACAKP